MATTTKRPFAIPGGFAVGNALRGVPQSEVAASVAIERNATEGVPYRAFINLLESCNLI